MHNITERSIETNGVRLRVTEAGDRGAPVVLLAHGFPELAYSWRHQIPALAAAGYHVIAPDQRGYGGSSRPDAVEDYDIVNLTADLTGLLDDVGADTAVIIGHDWGSVVAAHFPLLYPQRTSAVALLSVPPTPRMPQPPLEIMRTAFGDGFFYVIYFQQVGLADAELDADPARTIRRMFGGLRNDQYEAALAAMTAPGPQGFIDRLREPDGAPDWITQNEIDHYVTEFTRTGFTGGLNWYRNMDRNWSLVADAPAATIEAPTLFLAGSADPVLDMTPRDRVADIVTGPYREVLIDGAGHWVQQERPAEVNTALLKFLADLD
ncbi:alpha/beta hydrolase [Nocardia sp. NEAU-351]|uniref:Alpha/beta hydrolase n=1 Tax=Nocardia bovistercoris TaxID=2785916 RepID=A0A931N469_9NOCA|nr:alpha/beta hydrolase [Nocardia bovistercoris]